MTTSSGRMMKVTTQEEYQKVCTLAWAKVDAWIPNALLSPNSNRACSVACLIPRQAECGERELLYTYACIPLPILSLALIVARRICMSAYSSRIIKYIDIYIHK